MSGFDQPRFIDLVDWVEGRLQPQRSAQLTEAVARGDANTRESVEWVTEFLDLARAAPLPSPPDSVRLALRAEFDRRAAVASAAAVTPIPAMTLLFDSRRDVALAGVRSVEADERAVQLAYSDERADLVVDVTRPDADTVRVAGQVLFVSPDAPAANEVSIHGSAGVLARTHDVDELGRFTVDVVAESVVELVVENGEATLTASLDLTETQPGP